MMFRFLFVCLINHPNIVVYSDWSNKTVFYAVQLHAAVDDKS